MFNIVLYAPEIPANTGNIGRTCVVTGARLHLVEPLGFSLDDKTVRRAGLGYWQNLDVTTYAGWEDFLARNGLSPADERLHLLTKKHAAPMRRAPTAMATTWSLAVRARAFPSHCLPRRPSAASASRYCAIVTHSITPRLGEPTRNRSGIPRTATRPSFNRTSAATSSTRTTTASAHSTFPTAPPSSSTKPCARQAFRACNNPAIWGRGRNGRSLNPLALDKLVLALRWQRDCPFASLML